MTFRSICIAVYVFFYLIFTTPERIRLKKLEQTDPQKASRIAQEHVQKVFRHLLKISGVTIEVNGLENIPDEAALFVGNHSSYFRYRRCHSRWCRLCSKGQPRKYSRTFFLDEAHSLSVFRPQRHPQRITDHP